MSTGSAHTPNRHGVDTEALKLAHPIEEVIARYGIELRRQGQALVGRCPLHHDRGRPNLHVWPASSSWWCFRCSTGGDVIRWVQLVEQVDFRQAVDRLDSGIQRAPRALAAPGRPSQPRPLERDPQEAAVLHAATMLYHQRLLSDATAMAYLAGRGIVRATVEACHLGYAAGDELIPYLAWRRLGLEPALRVGLLGRNGREFLAGRIVVPDLRGQQPVWLVGRLLAVDLQTDDSADPPPKYLGLHGSKPLLGLEQAGTAPSVIATEGVFDWLTLRRWGYPTVALLGTHARPDIVERLRGFQRVYLVLDRDDTGLEATIRLADALGPAAIAVALPDGIKDVAELAPRGDGQAIFARALLDAVGATPPELVPARVIVGLQPDPV
jgi:DNA primase